MSREDKTGLVHIYCGDGKGKTTAAVGQALRCAGGGGRVLFFQFLKSNVSGERSALGSIDGIELRDGPDDMKFVWNMTDEEKAGAREYYTKRFRELCAEAGDFDMLVLDEVIPALKYDFVPAEELLEFLRSKPDGLEVVMTGREPEKKLVELSDYVTEMKKIKHPFDRGVAMRKYIEI